MASSWYIDTTVSDMVSMYHATGSVSMDVGHLPLLALLSGTLCRMTCGIRRFLRTATDSRAPSNKKWNFRTQFLENFRTISGHFCQFHESQDTEKLIFMCS